MLKLLGVDCDKIILSGITFNAGFLFTNSHEILAVMFEVSSFSCRSNQSPDISRSNLKEVWCFKEKRNS